MEQSGACYKAASCEQPPGAVPAGTCSEGTGEGPACQAAEACPPKALMPADGSCSASTGRDCAMLGAVSTEGMQIASAAP